jgi:hypothetical protein
MDSRQRIKAAAGTLTVGFLLAVAFAATAVAGNAANGVTAQERNAVLARGQAMNRVYGLGAYSAGAKAQQAVERRNQAIDEYYGLGRSTVGRVSNPFDWGDAGIGAGAMFGALILAGGLAVAARRRGVGPTSFPSTT